MSIVLECPKCDGTGFYEEDPFCDECTNNECPECHGVGFIRYV